MPLLLLLLIYLILIIAGIRAIIILMKNAPLRWEDKDGFHLEKEIIQGITEEQNKTNLK